MSISWVPETSGYLRRPECAELRTGRIPANVLQLMEHSIGSSPLPDADETRELGQALDDYQNHRTDARSEPAYRGALARRYLAAVPERHDRLSWRQRRALAGCAEGLLYLESAGAGRTSAFSSQRGSAVRDSRASDVRSGSGFRTCEKQ